MAKNQPALFNDLDTQIKERTRTTYVLEDGSEFEDKLSAQKAAAAHACQPYVERFLDTCMQYNTERFKKQLRRHITMYEESKCESLK